MLAADVTPDMTCNLCGGKGHTASFFLKDGTKQFCASKLVRMENGVSANSIDEAPPQNEIGVQQNEYDFDAMTEAINALREDIAYTKQIAKKTYKNTFRSRSNNTPTASFTTEQDESELEEMDDSASDVSAHSLVNSESMFANSSAPKRYFNFKRRPKKS